MGSVPRPIVAGGMYHVFSRGNARAPIYLDDADYGTFLGQFEKVVERFEWRCHGFCLMPNHYHLLLETPEPNLPLGMHVLNLAYARYFNWRYDRVGHVFQGPYRLRLIRTDAYLVELSRYIVLNPVRAHVVLDPGDWRWTSYRATAGLEQAPPYLEVDRVRDFFGGADAFTDFVAAPQALLATYSSR
jgi:putative transposase